MVLGVTLVEIISQPNNLQGGAQVGPLTNSQGMGMGKCKKDEIFSKSPSQLKYFMKSSEL